MASKVDFSCPTSRWSIPTSLRAVSLMRMVSCSSRRSSMRSQSTSMCLAFPLCGSTFLLLLLGVTHSSMYCAAAAFAQEPTVACLSALSFHSTLRMDSCRECLASIKSATLSSQPLAFAAALRASSNRLLIPTQGAAAFRLDSEAARFSNLGSGGKLLSGSLVIPGGSLSRPSSLSRAGYPVSRSIDSSVHVCVCQQPPNCPPLAASPSASSCPG
mmetsp:Transcript_57485/g.136727  ORF Transcript_57485/g.136727 Transcript_57485/m.136727 type:complete len:215 (+) Transcript_57485:3426-4070(+)